MEGEEWTVVGKKNKKNNGISSKNKIIETLPNYTSRSGKKKQKETVCAIDVDYGISMNDIPDFIEYAHDIAILIESSSMYKKLIASLSNILSVSDHGDSNNEISEDDHSEHREVDIIGLGIGSITSSPSCFLQFCLFLALKYYIQKAGYSSPSTILYDPVISDKDRKLISHFGISIPTDSNFGIIKSPRKAIFYMPHCPYQLYCNVLYANWTNLSEIFIIGNSFSFYSLSRPSRSTPAKHDCVQNIESFCTEISIVEDKSYLILHKENLCRKLIGKYSFGLYEDSFLRAFNNTSVHYFSLDGLEKLQDSGILSTLCPSLEEIQTAIRSDLEIIST